MFYPSTRYHKSGATRVIQNPDQEHPDWTQSPQGAPPVPTAKLAPCCEALVKKFDRAYRDLLTKLEVMKVDLDAAIQARDGALLDIDILERAAREKAEVNAPAAQQPEEAAKTAKAEKASKTAKPSA